LWCCCASTFFSPRNWFDCACCIGWWCVGCAQSLAATCVHFLGFEQCVSNLLGVGEPLVCPTCDAKVCARCGKEYHGNNNLTDNGADASGNGVGGGGGKSCETVTDLTLQEYRKDKHLQPCPACRREVGAGII
jgi:hypothetical protein